MKEGRAKWEELTEERKCSIIHNRDRNNLHTACKSGAVRLSQAQSGLSGPLTSSFRHATSDAAAREEQTQQLSAAFSAMYGIEQLLHCNIINQSSWGKVLCLMQCRIQD